MRRLSRFYLSYLELYQEYLPDFAKSALEVGRRHSSGNANYEELVLARKTCMEWVSAHFRGDKSSASVCAVQAEVIGLHQCEAVTTDDTLHYDLNMFLAWADRAADHSADLEPYLRAAFESP